MPGCREAFFSNYAVTYRLTIIRCPLALALNRPIQEKVLGTNILKHDTLARIIDNFVFVLVPIFCHSVFVFLDKFPFIQVGVDGIWNTSSHRAPQKTFVI